MKRIIIITLLFLRLVAFPVYADIFGPIDNLGDLLDVSISSPADTEVLTYDSATGKWKNAPGGAGSGDVTDVGDCTGGACFDGTSDGGTYLQLYDAQGATKFQVGDNAGAVVITLPNTTGTLIHTESDPQVNTLSGVTPMVLLLIAHKMRQSEQATLPLLALAQMAVAGMKAEMIYFHSFMKELQMTLKQPLP